MVLSGILGGVLSRGLGPFQRISTHFSHFSHFKPFQAISAPMIAFSLSKGHRQFAASKVMQRKVSRVSCSYLGSRDLSHCTLVS